MMNPEADIVSYIRLPADFSKPIKIDLSISRPGAFLYWVEYDSPTPPTSGLQTPVTRVKGREGYFNIDPILRTRKRSPILSPSYETLPVNEGGVVSSELVNIPLDGLAILTVVSKWMGPMEEWTPHLTEAMQRGYNMLHYTPLQLRGESKSPYSIADQLAFDDELFDANWTGTREDSVNKVKAQLKECKDKYGLLSLTDVVLNHTANNSPWLLEHPEAGTSALKYVICRCGPY
jgi:glycogen debranching enzyme